LKEVKWLFKWRFFHVNRFRGLQKSKKLSQQQQYECGTWRLTTIYTSAGSIMIIAVVVVAAMATATKKPPKKPHFTGEKKVKRREPL